MTPELLAAYHRNRLKYPDAGARTAFQWAKIEMRRRHLDWDEQDGKSIGEIEIDGFTIKVEISDDYYADFTDMYGELTMKRKAWNDGAFENPYWREWHKDRPEATKGYHSDYCGSRHDDDGAAQWYYTSSGDTFAEYRAYLRKTHGRHDSWLLTMERFRKECDDIRQAVNDRYGNGPYSSMLVSATAYIDDIEVAETSFGGYTWERNYSQSLDLQLDEIAADILDEIVSEAKGSIEDRAKELRAQASKLQEQAIKVMEYKEVRA